MRGNGAVEPEDGEFDEAQGCDVGHAVHPPGDEVAAEGVFDLGTLLLLLR